jgi:hypothetical protein
MQRRTPLLMLGVSVLAATLTCLATNARCQTLDSILNAADKADLDSLGGCIPHKKLSMQTEPSPNHEFLLSRFTGRFLKSRNAPR